MTRSGTGSITRRALLGSAAAVALATGLPGAGAALAQEAPRRGGILNVVQNWEPAMLTAAFNPSTPIVLVSSKIMEGLVAYDAKQQPIPALATSWTVSPDGLTYTFKLREGVKWHDGKPFSAADVAFSISEVWSKLHPRSGVTWSNLAGVETPDAMTVVVKLSKPVPFLLSMLGNWDAQVIPKHLYENTDIRTNPANNAPVGTGPFVFKEWQRGQYIRLERNPNYWQEGKPYLDQVIVKVMPEGGSRAAAVEAGEAHLGQFNPVAPSDLKRLLAKPELAVTTEGYQMFAPMALIEVNTRNEYLKDKRVRQAIMHALDRKFILDNILYGYGKIATGPLTSDSPFYTTDGVPLYGQDLKKANALLDEAGFPRKGSAPRFKLTTELAPSPEFSRMAEYLKQSLARIGIEVEIRSSDNPTFLRRVYTDYDFNLAINFIFMFADPSAGVQRLYYAPNIRKGVAFANASGYSNPELDKVWERAREENDLAKRKVLFAQAQRTIAEDLPIMNLFEFSFTTVYNKKLRNPTVGPDGAYGNFATAWLAE